MSVLVFLDQSEGKFKKAAHEAATYANKLAQSQGGTAVGIAFGSIDSNSLAEAGEFGLSKVVHVNNPATDNYDSRAFAKAISAAAEKEGSKTVVLSFNQRGKSLGPRISVRMKAGYVPGASALPDSDGNIPKGVFSGKAIAHYKINTEKKIIAINANTLPPEKVGGSAEVEVFDGGLSETDFAVKVISKEKLSGSIPLSEAELVVSAGRGLKGPENWGMVEELAGVLNAATACSRAVSDVDWRPHHEHVGQTGLTVRPNLYIAIAISGAIQHLAGVNNSKTIVVINTDPEAPFFKAADYGIVGDAFDVVPRLTEAIRNFKASQS
ncbi:MAG: electron transfer flavoprotein subunit alpha/FixB family protein [Chitinophagales bacterium]|nr:electron transfer flavoprotein subunit alpha/FixB family protein [Chitinophagales bacterium]